MTDLEKIVEQATDSILKYGIRSVSMDDIAHTAAISKKTLYQYVGNKENLLTLVVDNLSNTFSTQLYSCSNQTEAGPKEQLQYIAMYILIFSQENQHFLQQLRRFHQPLLDGFDNRQERSISEVLESIYPKLKSEGLLKDSVSKDLFFYIFIRSCRLKGFTRPSEEDWLYQRRLISFLIDGLFL